MSQSYVNQCQFVCVSHDILGRAGLFCNAATYLLLPLCPMQVAKSLLDAASQQSKAQAPAVPAVSLEGDSLLQSISQLLRFRCRKILTLQ